MWLRFVRAAARSRPRSCTRPAEAGSIGRAGTRLAAAVGLILAIACSNAAADWTPVGGSAKIFAAYADKASIKKSGDGVRMLGLYDFLMADLSADGRPHGSTVVLREYDCREKRVRLLAYVDYAGQMGEGRVISPPGAKGPDHWDPVVPGSLDEALLAMACAGPD